MEITKKLIIFSYDFPPLDGGIARLCNEIANRAVDYYNQVIVLTRKKNKEYVTYKVNSSLQLTEVRTQRIHAEKECFNFLRKIKNKESYHVICGVWHPEATIALLAEFKNVFILAHGTEYLSGTSKFRKYFWFPFYAKYILRRAERVFANSRYTENLVRKIQPKAHVVTISLAVDHCFFKPLEVHEKERDHISICTVSRVLQFKGHDFIIKTLAKLPEEYKNQIRYNIAGSGPYLPKLKELIKESNLESIVSFKGFIKDENLPLFYNENDLFILCTREVQDSTQVEGFGLVFLEAQSCGIPTIGTRTGGILDAIKEGNGGWLIEQDNGEQLSDLLIHLLDNKNLLKKMGIKARIRVEKEATWEIYCKNLFNEMRR
jgi:phosphatidylinositol alpha-1,6-mannosyltransferase